VVIERKTNQKRIRLQTVEMRIRMRLKFDM
jgi:hypothetical protein